MRLTADLIESRLPPRREPRMPAPTLDEATMRAALDRILADRPPGERLHLFSYGALMWDSASVPGAEAAPADAPGFARSFCLRDIHNRGVPEAPGLTLGIRAAPGARCGGVLYTLPEGRREERAIWSAWQQEMSPGFYTPVWLAALPQLGGRAVRAIGFVANPSHPLYAGDAPEEQQATVLAGAVGPQGPDAEYLRRATESLREGGVPDPLLERLADRVADRLEGMVGATGIEPVTLRV